MTSNHSDEYHLARIEARRITLARLQESFKHPVIDIKELETAVQEYLLLDPCSITPWHRSESGQLGTKEGVRAGALEFYREHQRQAGSSSVPTGILETATSVADGAEKALGPGCRQKRPWSPARRRRNGRKPKLS